MLRGTTPTFPAGIKKKKKKKGVKESSIELIKHKSTHSILNKHYEYKDSQSLVGNPGIPELDDILVAALAILDLLLDF